MEITLDVAGKFDDPQVFVDWLLKQESGVRPQFTMKTQRGARIVAQDSSYEWVVAAWRKNGERWFEGTAARYAWVAAKSPLELIEVIGGLLADLDEAEWERWRRLVVSPKLVDVKLKLAAVALVIADCRCESQLDWVMEKVLPPGAPVIRKEFDAAFDEGRVVLLSDDPVWTEQWVEQKASESSVNAEVVSVTWREA